MAESDAESRYLDRLRGWRVRKERDQSLSFIADQFKDEVTKPYKQLKSIAVLWEELVPAEMLSSTRLDSLARGVLKVTVSSASVSYELDRLLRSGLQKQLIDRHKGPAFRRVRIRVGKIDDRAKDRNDQPR